MITFDESPKGPSFMQLLASSLGQGANRYADLRQQRSRQDEAQQISRLNNLLDLGGGEIEEPDAQFLTERGLSSRFEPLQAALAGPKRYRIKATPEQQRAEASAQRNERQVRVADENASKTSAINQWVSEQDPNTDPVTIAQAYFRHNVEVPKLIMDLVNAKQQAQYQTQGFAQQEKMAGRRQMNLLEMLKQTGKLTSMNPDE
jgi:hypothetical protein